MLRVRSDAWAVPIIGPAFGLLTNVALSKDSGKVDEESIAVFGC